MARNAPNIVNTGIRIIGDITGSAMYLHPGLKVLCIYEGARHTLAAMSMNRERWQELADFAAEQVAKVER